MLLCILMVRCILVRQDGRKFLIELQNVFLDIMYVIITSWMLLRFVRSIVIAMCLNFAICLKDVVLIFTFLILYISIAKFPVSVCASAIKRWSGAGSIEVLETGQCSWWYGVGGTWQLFAGLRNSLPFVLRFLIHHGLGLLVCFDLEFTAAVLKLFTFCRFPQTSVETRSTATDIGKCSTSKRSHSVMSWAGLKRRFRISSIPNTYAP